jgi:NAD(P)-dependent dehydrogenase (short-subunit alcohol dehydrogenase family)
VDVRILLPAHNNWPWVGSMSRGGYRFLMESGVRLFEWQGPMIHAKTSVADGLWSRVGSSNLNNASLLGPSPQPPLRAYPLDELRRVYEANVIAPLALVQLALPRLVEGARVLNVTSDAGVEAYEGWGGYGSSKAALEQWSAVLAAEQPDLRVYAVDPGDMRTQLYQEAYPGEDISDHRPPEESVPGLFALIEGDLPSGRHRASELAEVTV